MTTCELCGEEKETLDFNVLMPTWESRVEGDVCLDCWGNSLDDYDVVAQLLLKRIQAAGEVAPVDPTKIPVYFKRPDNG